MHFCFSLYEADCLFEDLYNKNHNSMLFSDLTAWAYRYNNEKIEKPLGPGHIESFYLLVFPNKRKTSFYNAFSGHIGSLLDLTFHYKTFILRSVDLYIEYDVIKQGNVVSTFADTYHPLACLFRLYNSSLFWL